MFSDQELRLACAGRGWTVRESNVPALQEAFPIVSLAADNDLNLLEALDAVSIAENGGNDREAYRHGKEGKKPPRMRSTGMNEQESGEQLVASAREAVSKHRIAWRELVPDPHTVNLAAEADEDAAHEAMVSAKSRLRAHVLQTYGVDISELCNLTSS
jgi:hypothetical protein